MIYNNNQLEAIVLCGGYGKRLNNLTLKLPKSLIRINDKPILEYIIEHLLFYKIYNINLAVGYKSELIKDYILSRDDFSSIKIHDGGNISIIERIKKILKQTKSECILVIYGDTISDININKLFNYHIKINRPIVAVKQLQLSFGIFDIDNSECIINYEEKPALDKWINIGYFLINKSFYNDIHSNDSWETFISNCILQKNMYSFIHDGEWITVNTKEELEKAKIDIFKLKK